METVALAAAFLGFIAWRERQHAAELRAVASRRGDGGAPAPVASSRRRRRGKPEKARVISADDDAAWNEAHGHESEEQSEGDDS